MGVNGTARYVRVAQFCALTGYTLKAVNCKIAERKWLQGREWIKAPDGHVLIDMEGYYKWAEKGLDLV